MKSIIKIAHVQVKPFSNYIFCLIGSVTEVPPEQRCEFCYEQNIIKKHDKALQTGNDYKKEWGIHPGVDAPHQQFDSENKQ